MKRLVTTAFFLLSLSAHATVGVAVGHHTWADDSFPVIGPGEQAKVFVVEDYRGNGLTTMFMAVDKCLDHFKITGKRRGEKREFPRGQLFGGVCFADGFSENTGHSVVFVGAPGDNQFIATKALGVATREEALRIAGRNGVPLERMTKVWDQFDKHGRRDSQGRPIDVNGKLIIYR